MGAAPSTHATLKGTSFMHLLKLNILNRTDNLLIANPVLLTTGGSDSLGNPAGQQPSKRATLECSLEPKTLGRWDMNQGTAPV